jgi:hypothetical protein
MGDVPARDAELLQQIQNARAELAATQARLAQRARELKRELDEVTDAKQRLAAAGLHEDALVLAAVEKRMVAELTEIVQHLTAAAETEQRLAGRAPETLVPPSESPLPTRDVPETHSRADAATPQRVTWDEDARDQIVIPPAPSPPQWEPAADRAVPSFTPLTAAPSAGRDREQAQPTAEQHGVPDASAPTTRDREIELFLLASVVTAAAVGIIVFAFMWWDSSSSPSEPRPTAPAAVVSASTSTATRNPTPVPSLPTAIPTATSPVGAVGATPTPASMPTSTPSTPPVRPTAQVVSQSTPTSQTPTPFAPVATGEPVVQRLAAAEANLRSGRMHIVIEYSGGTQMTAEIVFDLQHASGPRMRMTSTYTSATNTQTAERILIGAASWERQADGTWLQIQNVEGAWGQLQAYLPHIAAVENVDHDSEQEGLLIWYEASRGLEITVRVNPVSGVPELMRQVSQQAGTVLTVTYTEWNTTVQIEPPGTS